MSSKATELTKVEQDALRYRVLRRLFSELKAALRIGPDVMAIGAPALDHTCDEATRLEDVAGVLIESTHPSLQLASSSSIEESCVQATREIATSLERGIYQPLLPLDAQHLLACATKAERAEKLATGVRANDTMLVYLLLAAGGSIRVSFSLVRDVRLDDYVIERAEDEAGVVYHIKRKQEHQR
jgi:hypothetical protein